MSDSTNSSRPDSALEEFLRRLDAGEALSPEEFVLGCDPKVRDAALQECREILRIRALLCATPSPEGCLPTVGPYVALRILNHGGTATVYEARDSRSGQHVAIKILHPHLAQRLSPLERFRREAAIGSRLVHPHLVSVIDHGEFQGTSFLVMDRIYEQSLADLIEEWVKIGLVGSKSRVAMSVRMVREIAEALQYLHDEGVIHRDVKPHNILLDANGRAYLADLGLAENTSLALTLTSPAELLGSAQYMSPEHTLQLRRFDGRSDVFSLGVVLYQTLALEVPFQAKDMHRLVYEISFVTPKRITQCDAQVPEALEILCDRAMEKVPHHRFPTAAAFASELRQFQERARITIHRPSAPVQAWRGLRRRPLRLAMAALVTLTILLAFGWTWWRDHRNRELALDDYASATGSLALKGCTKAALASLLGQGSTLRLRFGEAVESAVVAGESRLTREIEDRTRSQLAVAEAALRLASPSDSSRWPKEPEFLAALAEAESLADFLPPGSPLRERSRSSAFYPRLSLEIRPATESYSVEVLAFDLATAEFDPTPVVSVTNASTLAVPPGHYRIVVRSSDCMAELTRSLITWGREYPVVAYLRPHDSVIPTMVPIAGGPVRRSLPRVAVEDEPGVVRPFYIDPTEVTFGEYREFLSQTGHREPLAWPRPYDSAFDRLPVTGVTLPDAMSFAEWKGKRLPTAIEWQRAARGAEGFPYPWGIDSTVVAEANVGPPLRDWPPAGSPEVLALFRSRIQPVGFNPRDRRREGDRVIHDTLGNLLEWIDNLPVATVRGELCLQYGSGNAMGCAWAFGDQASLPKLTTSLADQPRLSLIFGFRCAKSPFSQ